MALTIDPFAARHVVVTLSIAWFPARSTVTTTTLFTTGAVTVMAGPLRWLNPPSLPAG